MVTYMVLKFRATGAWVGHGNLEKGGKLEGQRRSRKQAKREWASEDSKNLPIRCLVLVG